MLGPLQFLVYINDLPSKVYAKARLFADECLLYRNIMTDEDAESLQDDLNKLQDWESDWQMHFNPDKCELIRITNKRKIINASYHIQNVQLKQAKRAKYLRLTFSNTLPWNLIGIVRKKDTKINIIISSILQRPVDYDQTDKFTGEINSYLLNNMSKPYNFKFILTCVSNK